MEETPSAYIAKLVEVFTEVKRVLKPEGTLWLNLGDTYHSGKGLDKLKPKDLIGIPWRTALALQEDGWYLRADIIWHKPNPMPESVKDRPTKSHEYIFLLSKSETYYYDYEAVLEVANYDGRRQIMVRPQKHRHLFNQNCQTISRNGGPRWRFKNLQDKGQPTHSFHERRALHLADQVYAVRNKRDVWTVPTKPCKELHFATFPPDLIEPCVLAGCPKHGIVLDPFGGSGTTAVVAILQQRNFILYELNPKYVAIAQKRIAHTYRQLTIFDILPC